MNRTHSFSPNTAWARHLTAPVAAPHTGLSPAEALRLQRLHDRLLTALQANDRAALRSTRQEVLHAAFTPAQSPGLRTALHALVWRMAALLPAARRRGRGHE